MKSFSNILKSKKPENPWLLCLTHLRSHLVGSKSWTTRNVFERVFSNSLVLSVFLLSQSSFAFVLVSPNYKLSNPQETVVNVERGGCAANGISDESLLNSIQHVIAKYWNTVGESELHLYVGDPVDRVATSSQANSIAGEILVGCESLPSGATGVAFPNSSNGSAVVLLNADQFVPGGYLDTGLIGVLTHELGHAIGLGHSDDPGSVMTYRSNNWGPAANDLSRDDRDGVIFLYPNKSSTFGLVGGCDAVAMSTSSRSSRFTMWHLLFEGLFLLLVGRIFSSFLRRRLT